MVNRLRYRVDSARQIMKTEGLASLISRVSEYINWRYFVYITQYLYETTADDFQTENEADYMPKIDKFTINIVSTNEEADKLESDGFEFRSHDINSRYYLDNGAVAFCIFVGTELAHIGWIEMTKQLRGTNIVKVDYSNNEVHGAGGWTNPKYRRLGLNRYGAFKRRQFVFSKGKTVSRSSISKSNIASQASTIKTDRIYAEVRYLKILGWESIKTTYVDGYKLPT